MGIRRRKSRATRDDAARRTAGAMPPQAKTLGHQPAINFTQAILEQRWADAEAAFSSQPLVDQAHMVSVASDCGGPAEHLDGWESGTTGLSELVRGARQIVAAWDARSGAKAEAVSVAAIDEFHTGLEEAERLLHAAAELMPTSSIPWQQLLTSGRGLHVNRMEMDDRYVRHIERGELLSGHLSFQQLISRKWAGSHEEMWEHAEWITRTAPAGSPNHVVVAVALIEHHIKSDVRHDNICELPQMIRKTEIIGEAAHLSYGDPSFDVASPQGAMALSAWFTLHYLMGNWANAAELIPMIEDRFARFPMVYFQDATWPELRQYVNARLVQVA